MIGPWRKWMVVALPVIFVAPLLFGCAKRPATAAAAAPPPTGAPSTTSPPPVAMKPAPTPAAPPVPVAPPVARTDTARPAPRDFAPHDALKDIHFDFDKYDIRKPDAAILDANAKWLKASGQYLVLIEGHADERGTNEYNLALGDRRAKATMNYLVSQGVPSSRITMLSYGEDRPACREHTEECWAKNRRSHFLVKVQ